MKFAAILALLLGSLTEPSAIQAPETANAKPSCSAAASLGSTIESQVAAAGANVCYCGGKSFGEGHQACMGGWKMVCTTKGWANMKSGADNIRCSPDKCE